jgi:hypothetical protein
MQVFLDLDGVVCDFVRPSYEIHGLAHALDFCPPTVYDYWNEMGLTEKEFWAPIESAGFDWWAQLPCLPWTYDLLSFLDDVCPGFEFATKPYNADSAAGKWNWLDRYSPDEKRHLTSDKSSLSGPGRILIDDSPQQIFKWQENGGTGILFPASYNVNSIYLDDPVSCVRKQLEMIHDDY